MLNQDLHARLAAHFGKVRVLNQGQPFRCSRRYLPGGQVEVAKLQGGEEYAVNCPSCGDTRGRLYVNHMYGQRVHGVLMDSLFHCYNEGHHCRREVAQRLEQLVRGAPIAAVQLDELPPLTMEQVVYESATQHAAPNPAYARRLDQLVSTHPACAYMLGRGFDPYELGQLWGCYYSDDPNPKLPYAYQRIIIPLYYQGITVGYQARAIPGYTRRQNPKYWTAARCKKSYFLGGYDQARAVDFVVVTEGPTKQWRIGAPAVSILGSTLSAQQAQLLVDTWGPRAGPIVFVSDPGFEDVWHRNAQAVVPHVRDLRRVVVVNPPQDAGDMRREDIRRLICEHSNGLISVDMFLD